MRMATLALLMFTAVGSQAALGASRCSISDIEVRGMSWRVSGNYLTTVGELVNHCAESIGIKIKVTGRDSDGKVVDTEDEWPAGTVDIPPNKPYPFKTRHRDMKGAASVSVDVIEVYRWER